MDCEKFWFEHPPAILHNFEILPEKSMCMDAKLNALTRLAIIISIILYFAKIEEWKYFAIGSIVFILVLRYIVYRQQSKEGFDPSAMALPAARNCDGDIKTLTPVVYHDQSYNGHTPIDNIEGCKTCGINDTYEKIDDTPSNSQPNKCNLVNDVEYIDDEDYKPKNFFGVTSLMPDDEYDHVSGKYEGLDRKQLQYLNTQKQAEREIEAREGIVQFIKQEMDERFEPDEYNPLWY